MEHVMNPTWVLLGLVVGVVLIATGHAVKVPGWLVAILVLLAVLAAL